MKLAKHSLHPWSSLTIPQRVVHVSPYTTLTSRAVTSHPPLRHTLHTTRPHLGTAAPQRGQTMVKVGSPTYWASRLGMPKKGCPQSVDPMSMVYVQALMRFTPTNTAWRLNSLSPDKTGPRIPNSLCESAPHYLRAPAQKGEAALGISHIGSCIGKHTPDIFP